MLKTTSILLFLLIRGTTYAQANNIGLQLTLDGKIEFSHSEPNYNGNLDDTVFVTYEGKSYMEDLRNVKYGHFIILECPSDDWMIPSNLTPSRVNDTTPLYPTEPNFPFTFTILDSTNLLIPIAPQPTEDPLLIPEVKKFHDVIDGLELTDSIATMLEAKIKNYVATYRGRYEPYQVRNDLYKEISIEDSVVDKIAVYDYLVDMLVFYEYQDDNLMSITSYHWNSGVEFDSLNYDRVGNMTYFSRENIGSTREEYFVKYDRKDRVKMVTNHYSTSGRSDADSFTNPQIDVTKFDYDKIGRIKSKSTLGDDEKWRTVYFDFTHVTKTALE